MSSRYYLLFLPILVILVLSVAGQELPRGADSTQITDQQTEKKSDSTTVDTSVTAIEGTESVEDSVATDGLISVPPIAAAPKAQPAVPQKPVAVQDKESTRKIKLVKRKYNYRQQIVLAVGMMAFVAIMMSTAQSWNPK